MIRIRIKTASVNVTIESLQTQSLIHRCSTDGEGHRRQPSDTPPPPEIDPEVIRRELQNPVRAIYSPRNAEVDNNVVSCMNCIY